MSKKEDLSTENQNILNMSQVYYITYQTRIEVVCRYALTYNWRSSDLGKNMEVSGKKPDSKIPKENVEGY